MLLFLKRYKALHLNGQWSLADWGQKIGTVHASNHKDRRIFLVRYCLIFENDSRHHSGVSTPTPQCSMTLIFVKMIVDLYIIWSIHNQNKWNNSHKKNCKMMSQGNWKAHCRSRISMRSRAMEIWRSSVQSTFTYLLDPIVSVEVSRLFLHFCLWILACSCLWIGLSQTYDSTEYHRRNHTLAICPLLSISLHRYPPQQPWYLRPWLELLT